MHAIHDLRTHERIEGAPVDTVLERHVWLGQEALLLRCERIETGSIVGARTLVKGRLPARVVAGGIPARVLREAVSWGRDLAGMTAEERAAINFDSVED
jgi:acetyltransferase-like isoleucine patch superfamily enzyme